MGWYESSGPPIAFSFDHDCTVIGFLLHCLRNKILIIHCTHMRTKTPKHCKGIVERFYKKNEKGLLIMEISSISKWTLHLLSVYMIAVCLSGTKFSV